MDTPAILRKRADRRARATSVQWGMLAVLVLGFAPAAVGCVGSGGSSGLVVSAAESSSGANVETQPDSRGAVAIGQPVATRNGYKLTVQDAGWLALWRSPLGNRFWTVSVRACAPPSNTGPVIAFSDEYTLTLNDGDELHPLVGPYREPSFASGTIPPGQCEVGWLAYEVPNGRSPVALQYGPHRFDVYAS